MAEEIAELADDIGFPVEALRAMLPRDNPFVDRLVNMGYDEESANDVSFIGDLRNVIILMRSHGVSAKTAASLLRQTPELPFEFDSPEEEQKEDDDQENKENENETETNSSSSSCDESKEAKRARLDPDYQLSSASDSSTTTAGNSQEEDETDTETEEESWCPSRSTSPEIISSSEDN
jgi:hypothetical protein